MTGAVVGSTGLVTSPSFTFNGSTKTGFYLASANQIGVAINGIQAATFNSDTSTTWAGGATFGGGISATKGTIPIGAVMDFAGSSPPSGWLFCAGQQISTTTFAALFSVIGTTYGSGAGTFGLPDYRGRVGFGKDDMGGTPVNRITAGVSGITGTTLGATGGNENSQIHSHSASVTDPGHNHALPAGINNNTLSNGSGGTVSFLNPAGQGGSTYMTAVVAATTGISVTVANHGVGTSENVPPAIIVLKIIYAGN